MWPFFVAPGNWETEMPGIDETENEWRYRVKDPGLFKPESFRRKDLGGGVAVVMGKLKNPPEGQAGSMVTQSFRFNKKNFKTKEDVRSWLKGHKITAAETKMTEALLDGWWDITAAGIKFWGTMRGKPSAHTFSEEDLQTMAADYSPKVLEAPVTLGHTDVGEAHGWIEALRVKEKDGRLYLQAKLKELSETLRTALLEGRYRSRSVEVFINFMKTGKPYLGGLAFLGAGTPAMKNLSPFPTIASDICEGFILCSGTGGPEAMIFDPVPNDFNLETKEYPVNAQEIKDAVIEGVSSVLGKFKGSEAESDAVQKLAAVDAEKLVAEKTATDEKLAAAEKRVKEAEDKLKAMETEAELATFKAGIETARDESRITPVDADMYINLGEDLPEEKRKEILEKVSKREPNKILSELSQASGENKSASVARAKLDRPFEKVSSPADPVHEKAVQLMEADKTGKLTYPEALDAVYAEEPDLGKLIKADE